MFAFWDVYGFLISSNVMFCQISKKFYQSKKKYKTQKAQYKLRFCDVSPTGFEPVTASLEGRCSIQLSYEPIQELSSEMVRAIKN